MPPSHFEDVLSHIQNWAENISSSLLIEKLLYDASKNIRFNNIDQWLDQIYSWLNNPNTKFHSIGLKATLPLISDNTFENFPPLFAMITPYFQKDNYYVQNELYSILSGLIIRSPVETSYFFKQILSSGISKVHLRTIRKFLPKFDKNTQETIRDSINNAVINENQ